jgi:hypothetical protein
MRRSTLHEPAADAGPRPPSPGDAVWFDTVDLKEAKALLGEKSRLEARPKSGLRPQSTIHPRSTASPTSRRIRQIRGRGRLLALAAAGAFRLEAHSRPDLWYQYVKPQAVKSAPSVNGGMPLYAFRAERRTSSVPQFSVDTNWNLKAELCDRLSCAGLERYKLGAAL